MELGSAKQPAGKREGGPNSCNNKFENICNTKTASRLSPIRTTSRRRGALGTQDRGSSPLYGKPRRRATSKSDVVCSSRPTTMWTGQSPAKKAAAGTRVARATRKKPHRLRRLPAEGMSRLRASYPHRDVPAGKGSVIVRKSTHLSRLCKRRGIRSRR